MSCVYVYVLSQYHTTLIDIHEDADGKFFRKAGNMLPDYQASHHRKYKSQRQ